LETRVGNKELHRSRAQKFDKVSPVKVPDPLPGQCAAVVPQFGERHLRDYSLVRSQAYLPFIR
jgi:hypothetical protein